MIYSAPPLNGAQANLRVLRGTQPGLLDPSQPSRLLRFPDSILSFASFDPKTALADESSKPNNSGSLVPPKRIVIETTSKGASFWRFVPRARLEEGVTDEGVWPRVIDICGENVHCYQEQWEIYKLDPIYHCVVYSWPKCSTVAKVESSNHDFHNTDPYSGKRPRRSSPEAAKQAQKKARSRPPEQTDGTSSSESDKDEVEVEEMIIDESFSQKPKPGRRPYPNRREEVKKARQDRWEKNKIPEKRVQDDFAPADGSFMQVDSEGFLPSQSTSQPTEKDTKRKGSLFPESDNDSDRMSCDIKSPLGYKRARTSPAKSGNGVNRNRVSREKRRLDRLHQHAELNRQYRERKNAGCLRSTSVPSVSGVKVEATPGIMETHSQAQDNLGQAPVESLHEVEIAESIRKLRELEKDRPIWEEHRKRREARERVEEQERAAKAKQRRKEEEQLKEQREAVEREKRRAEQEAERLAREEELRQREIRQRRQRQRWESGPWTTHRALEHYRMLSDEFDTTKFTSGQCITFHDIPWPVLHAPSRLTVEDVDWSAVETFFSTVKSHMRLQDYREFVEKSHRRFHPDRWRARKIWAAVADETERSYLEVAANTVAQAITPIWRAMKGG